MPGKQESYATTTESLPPSTKLCSCCGFKNDLLTLSIREWICPECKTDHDRNENAAKNLREEGMILNPLSIGYISGEARSNRQ
ncbi:transposase [Microcystis aeruginosa]|uniref:transposase n=1 Tax=Microcystis aeruginosa TaxID=1126 RepID=UPI0020B12E20|nr:transposase [Microcystis aeruginosa]